MAHSVVPLAWPSLDGFPLAWMTSRLSRRLPAQGCLVAV